MKAIRIGLCVLFAFSVLAHGVVEVWSESILEIGASLLFITWIFLAYRDPEITIQWNPLNWPFLGFIGIGLLQLALHWSANPFFTRVELLRFSAYFIVFFLYCTGLSGTGRSREAGLVSRSFGIFGQPARNHPVFYVPRHDLLDPETFQKAAMFLGPM